MNIWEDIIETVEAHRQHSDLQEALLLATFLFEKSRILPRAEALLGLSASMGWPEKVAVAPIDDVAKERLSLSLQQLAIERPGDPSIGAVYWALGKLYDPSLITFFQAALKEQLNRNPGALYQVMIALDNLGEKVFGESRSYSIDDVAINIGHARKYLEQLENKSK